MVSAKGRDWSCERCLPINELVKERLPVQRDAQTWRRWFRNGLVINGERFKLPQIVIAGVIHSSVSAVSEVLSQASALDPPRYIRQPRGKKRRARA